MRRAVGYILKHNEHKYGCHRLVESSCCLDIFGRRAREHTRRAKRSKSFARANPVNYTPLFYIYLKNVWQAIEGIMHSSARGPQRQVVSSSLVSLLVRDVAFSVHSTCAAKHLACGILVDRTRHNEQYVCCTFYLRSLTSPPPAPCPNLRLMLYLVRTE